MKFLIFYLFVAGGMAVNVPYRPCTYKGHGPVNDVTSINIDPLPADGCDYMEPGSNGPKLCAFMSGGTYNITFAFHAGETSQTANVKLFATLFQLGKEQFDVNPPNACTNGIHCPIMAGTDVVYRVTVTAPHLSYQLKGIAEWVLIGDNDKAIFCVAYPFIFGAL